MVITREHNEFVIQFRFAPWIVNEVKQIPGRRFDPVRKAWVVPADQAEAVALFARSQRAKIIDPELIEIAKIEVPEMPELNVEIPLKRKLYPYQKRGVAYALEKKRLIIGDQPGLGKTAQAIAAVIAQGTFPCLVICPASLKENWKREWEAWSGEKAMILSSDNQKHWPLFFERGLVRVFIVNYESLQKYFVENLNRSGDGKLSLKDIVFNPRKDLFNSVIVDESHRVKSFATLQTKLVKGIATGKEVIMLITGTPVVNKPADLLPQLGIIDRYKEFGGYPNFKRRYCDIATKDLHDELSALLRKHCFYRREKSEVLTELPAKQRQMVLLDIANRKEYDEAERNIIEYLRRWKEATDEQLERAARGEVMVRIGQLKQISARGKVGAAMEFIEDIIQSGEKVIVFAHHKEVIEIMRRRYPRHGVTVTGDDSLEERQRNVDAFQNNPEIKVIFCSIKAAGVGLTLTAASRVCFIEMAWHPADHDQCEDRAHRIGQKDSVQCIYFLGKDTYDEDVYKIIAEKREMTGRIVGAEDQTGEVFTDLMNIMCNKLLS